ncbi:hypothetical protein EG327_006702, partial [Venturia inaequalis]
YLEEEEDHLKRARERMKSNGNSRDFDEHPIKPVELERFVEIMRNEHADECFPEFAQRCAERREKWGEWTNVRNGFKQYSEVWREDFGLEIYFTHQSITQQHARAFWDARDKGVEFKSGCLTRG